MSMTGYDIATHGVKQCAFESFFREQGTANLVAYNIFISILQYKLYTFKLKHN